MTRIVVDTDVLSFLFKNSQEAPRFIELLGDCQIVLSFQTVAELFKWTVVRNWQSKQIARLESELRKCIVVPYHRDLAWAWAQVTGECQKKGQTISAGDAWIAATAIRYNIALLTNNVRHYQAAEKYCHLKLATHQV